MIYRASPLICSTFKGVLPSQLFEHYHGPGGMDRLEFDLLVANEIAEQLNESVQDKGKKQRKSRGGAKGAVARRDQRRQLFSGADTLKHLQGLMGDKGE